MILCPECEQSVMGHIPNPPNVQLFCPTCKYAENLWFIPIELATLDTVVVYQAHNKPQGWNDRV